MGKDKTAHLLNFIDIKCPYCNFEGYTYNSIANTEKGSRITKHAKCGRCKRHFDIVYKAYQIDFATGVDKE